jgi:hypothetical protein
MPMTYAEYNAFCRKLPATTHVVQWGGAHVWKVGGKVFAIGGWHDDHPAFTFKVNDIAWEMLKQQPGCRPAPYLAALVQEEADRARADGAGAAAPLIRGRTRLAAAGKRASLTASDG